MINTVQQTFGTVQSTQCGNQQPVQLLNVLSWNCKGGDKNALDNFISTHQPDLVILQECNSNWYKTSQPVGYAGTTISEKHQWRINGSLLESDGNSNYCVLYKQSFRVVQGLQLLDYLNQNGDPNYPSKITVPNDVNQARTQSFAARIPAMMRLQDTNSLLTITLFNWHAHTQQDGIQARSFQYLKDSVEFRRAIGEAGDHDLVILAGDLNNTFPREKLA
ncbi:MAG: endonuclease/exonuclease/phosphatase family protein, partial [Tolypothrix sp. T3-bin4]|nr:endonuclease/exonuclease/phosphatase family protein [Tolypothrix sp. T3-bin4]